MTWQSSTCCCCISVRTGVMILGGLTWLNLLGEIDEFYPIRLAATAVAAIAFLIMIMDDSESKRKLFFWAFIVATSVTYVFTIFLAFEKLEEVKPWNQACDDINKRGELKNIHATNIDECRETIRNMIHTFITVMMILNAVLSIHYMSVVYTFWKQHGKAVDEEERVVLQDETA